MLQLYINGVELHVDDDFALDVEYHNQILSKYGTLSFPFTVPATQHNLAQINYAHRLDVRRAGYLAAQFAFKATWNTFPLLEGTATVTRTKITRGKSEIEMFVLAQKGHFYDYFANKMLPDVPMDYYEFANTAAYDTYLNDTKDYTYPTRLFAMFPINNPDLMLGTYKETEWNADIKHINRYVPSSAITGAFYGYRIPQPYLDNVLKHIISNAGYTSTNSGRYTYSYMAQAVIECDRYLDTIQLGAAGATDYLKCYTDASTDPGDQPSFSLSSFLPDYNVRDFLIELERKYGLRFIVDDRTKTVRIIQYNEVPNFLLQLAKTIQVEYAYEVEPLAEQEGGVNMSYSFDSDAATSAVRNRNEFVLTATVANFAALPGSIPDDKFPFYFVTDENRYYQYDNVTNAWVKRHYEFSPYRTNEDGYDLKDLDLSSLVMFDWDSTAGIATPIMIPAWIPSRKVWLPFTNRAAFEQSDVLVNAASTNTVLTRDMYAKNKPRILWYCGMHPDASGDNYPLGNSSLYNGNGTLISGLPSFESLYDPTDNAKNIYNKYHKQFIEWWQNRIPVKVKPLLSFEQLSTLDLTQPVWVKRLNCYIMFIKIPVKFTKRRIIIGEAEAVRYDEKN